MSNEQEAKALVQEIIEDDKQVNKKPWVLERVDNGDGSISYEVHTSDWSSLAFRIHEEDNRHAKDTATRIVTLHNHYLEREQAEARVAEIDKMFVDAKYWGSWMVEAANEREALATKWGLPQKYQARTADGKRTD